MAIDDPIRRPGDAGLGELKAERTARELARINKRLGLVLLLVALPYLLALAGLILALISGGDVNVTVV